jgi:hypothetical protein
VDVSPEMQPKVLEAKRYLGSSPMGNSGRMLAGTSEGGHAWDEISPSSSVKRNVVRHQVGAGTDLPGAVVLDTGCGLGQDLLMQDCCSSTVRAVGWEKELSLHDSLLEMHKYLLLHVPGWSGNVATQHGDSCLKGPFHLATNVSLYDGPRVTLQSNIEVSDKSHSHLIEKIMSTPSVDEFVSSKIAPASVMLRYAEMNPTIKEFLHQFYQIKLANMPFKVNKLNSTMWVRKKAFRLPRPQVPAALSTPVRMRSPIQNMIAAAVHADQKPKDKFNQFTVVKLCPGKPYPISSVQIEAKGRLNGITLRAVILVCSTLSNKLTGEQVWPGDEYVVEMSDVFWTGTFLGVAPGLTRSSLTWRS